MAIQRICALPRFSGEQTGEREILASAVFIIASLTDGIDGYLARRRGQITTMGMLLDPLADKLLIAAAFITLVQFNPALVPAWMAVVIIGREFLVSGLRSIAASEGFTIQASELGKFKMLVQIIAVVAVILARQPPAPRCQLLNIGVITPRKRQLELLDAVERLRAAGVDFHFRFVGDAPAADNYARAFLEKIRPLAAAGVASHSAPLPTAELVAECDRSHALVHFPSEEAFGLVVAESLARGCKFFGARAGGIVDITAGVAGTELYDVNDWTGLVAGLTAWMRNGFGRSADGARQIRDRYSPAVVAQRHLEIYREVLDRKND